MTVGKGLFIMSLNSQRLKDAVENKSNPHFKNEIRELDIFVFDNLEILNGIFFNEKKASQERDKIEELIQVLEQEFVQADLANRKLIRSTQVRRDLNSYILSVYTEFYTNPVFERHCKNQIFQNLQPKLKHLSVLNNRSNLLELLIPFLITEIALFLQIFSTGQYDHIYGMENEMDIIAAIRKGKYASFKRYFKKNVPYLKITPPDA